MTRLSMRIAAGIGALALAGSMSACADRPTTAATVGGERITVAEVDEVMAGLPEQIEAHPSAVLNIQMRSLAARQVAQQRGITNLRALAEQQTAQLRVPEELITDPEFRSLIIAQEEARALEQQLGTNAVNQAFERIPVTVNPRYGVTGLEELQTLRNTSLSRRAGSPQ